MGQKKGERWGGGEEEVSNYIVVHVIQRSHFYCLLFNASTCTHCILGLRASG